MERLSYERIGGDDNPLADSIMDRIKYDAYKIKIQAIDPVVGQAISISSDRRFQRPGIINRPLSPLDYASD